MFILIFFSLVDENKNNGRKFRVRLVGMIVLVFLIAALFFSFVVRQNEYSVVDTVSDFYVSFLDSDGVGDVSLVTDRFREVLRSGAAPGIVMCGFSSLTEVRVGMGAAFWNDASVSVTLQEATSSREALVVLKKTSGTWHIDAIACQP